MSTQTNPFDSKQSSAAYAKVDPVYHKSAQAIVEFQNPLDFNEEDILIDLGAGTGVSAQVLLDNGAMNLTLVDPSRAMLEQAEAKLGDSVNYLCAGAENFFANFPGNVSAIYALNCVHLFPDLLAALAGIACTLKKDGLFIFNISAPTYAFSNVAVDEKNLIQANLDFYKELNTLSVNPILEKTIDLLQDTLNGKVDQLHSQEKFQNIFSSLNFEYLESKEITIEVEADYQRNIWRMIAQGFNSDLEQVERIIAAVKLPANIKIRQALFKFKNLNESSNTPV